MSTLADQYPLYSTSPATVPKTEGNTDKSLYGDLSIMPQPVLTKAVNTTHPSFSNG